MKKIITILGVALFVAIFPVIVSAVAGPEDLNGANSESVEAADESTETTDDSTSASNVASTQNGNYNFSKDSNISEAIRARVLENNPLVGEMTMEEARELVREEAAMEVANKIQTSKPEYTPKNSDSVARKSEVEGACEKMIVLSSIFSDSVLGSKLETSAKTYLLSEDKVNQALDTADTRTGFAKFFIGPNYEELGIVKIQIEQNQVKIQEMNKIHAQLQNEADQTELKGAIRTLEAQNTALQNQLDGEEEVFSLFGWLARWISSY